MSNELPKVDPLYGPGKGMPRYGLKRQFLHAYRLGFRLPSDECWVEFESPLPADLQQALDKLRNRQH